MKKILSVVIALFTMSVAAMVVMIPSKAAGQQKVSQTARVIPDDVSIILNNSCTACHDKGGKALAKAFWSFSSWNKYSAKKQTKKANMICWAVNKGIMPPKGKAKKFPDMVPTASQKEVVCNWAKSLNGN